MTAKELLDAGHLAQAIDAVTAEVRAKPTDPKPRTTLFELLCYAGQWDRAARQLDALGGPESDPKLQAGVQVYRDLIEAERQRARVFVHGHRPRFMLAPTPEVTARLDALSALLQDRLDEATDALSRAEEHHERVAGEADGLQFDDIRDADDLLASVLEVFTPTGYFWVPWSQIQYLEVREPGSLRDLLWAPARLASFDGQLGEVFLPSLYPGTADSEDDAVKLGRRTDWVEDADGVVVRGRGRKMLLLGDEDRTVTDLRNVRFEVPESGGADAAMSS